MNQTNRADAAAKYLEAVGFTKVKEDHLNSVRFANVEARPLWGQPEPLPRVRYINNLGVWRLTDKRGWVYYANDIETAYLDWLEDQLERNADEDQGDLAMCCHEDALPVPSLKALAWSALGLLAVISVAALYCGFYR